MNTTKYDNTTKRVNDNIKEIQTIGRTYIYKQWELEATEQELTNRKIEYTTYDRTDWWEVVHNERN